MSDLFGSVSTEDQHMCDVFVIMPFKAEFTDVYNHVIRKVCTELKLVVKLGDDFFSNRQIITEIWSALNNCKLVIADCTERNPNVFYELGIAHTLDKKAITITKHIEDIPFDIRGLRYIEYTDSISGAAKLAIDLREAIVKILNLDPTTLTEKVVYSLQKIDPSRYNLSLSNNLPILKAETDKARQLKQYDWMVLFAEAWTKVAPGDISAYEDLGKAFIRSNQPQKAISVGERLIQLNRINYSGYQILGQAYSLLGEWDEAQKWQETALKYVTPRFRLFLLIELSETYEALGMVEEAISVLEELVSLADDYMKPSYTERLTHLKRLSGKH